MLRRSAFAAARSARFTVEGRRTVRTSVFLSVLVTASYCNRYVVCSIGIWRGKRNRLPCKHEKGFRGHPAATRFRC